MHAFVVAIFVLTYLGMAAGRVPGLRLDRAGIALIAVAALLGSGAVAPGDAWAAIDVPTLVLLFALMIVSAQFGRAGFYERCVGAVVRLADRPQRLLFGVVALAGVLSALLANDIVVFAMTPILSVGVAMRGLDPRPYLLGLAAGSNAGSAATVIGNPQNILIGQVGALDFWDFFAVNAPPAIFALVVVYLALRWTWRRELGVEARPVPSEVAAVVDRRQLAKAGIATLALVFLFSLSVPREIAALVIAALLLLSRRTASRELVAGVDWSLLLLFGCLFAVTAAFAATPAAGALLDWLAGRGWQFHELSVLAPLTLVLSNTVGNVPAVVLLTTLVPEWSSGALYALALLSTLAGNLLIVGSIANIIVAERAAASGVRLSFVDFARAGIPMTLAAMLAAAAWLWAIGMVSLA